MSDWFSSWFNTKYYHILYKNRDDNEAERFIKNLTKDLKIAPNSKILDLACGKGRHSVFLNKLGFNVEGCDLSKESINFAKKFENEKLHFFVHDMREPIQNKTYDYVLNLFTSIGYFEDVTDNLKMIQSIEHYTNKNGVLVIDFMNAEKVINHLIKTEVKEIDGVTFHIKREIVDGFIVKTIAFNDEGKAYKYQEKVQALTLPDFKKLFNKSAFSIYKVCGDYDLNNFDVNHSDRLIIYAKK
jgi:SAM-dependent methyltransferase